MTSGCCPAIWRLAVAAIAAARKIRDGLVEERLMATLSDSFGLLAVLLAVVGTLTESFPTLFAMRRNEIGIRMALGASRGDVVGIIVRQTLLLLVLGVSAALPLLFAAARGASSLLFDLQPKRSIQLCLGKPPC